MASLVYATFWQRLAAAVVDFAVLAVPALGLAWLGNANRAFAFAAAALQDGLFLGYAIYCHGRFGRTLGKHVMHIRVAQLDGAAIGWSKAWKRSAVDIGFSLVSLAGIMVALEAMGPEAFRDGGFLSIRRDEFQPAWAGWAQYAGIAWAWSELVVMLMNPQRRALHDFIAGTIVVQGRRGGKNADTGKE